MNNVDDAAVATPCSSLPFVFRSRAMRRQQVEEASTVVVAGLVDLAMAVLRHYMAHLPQERTSCGSGSLA
jgi:hypothetical protein